MYIYIIYIIHIYEYIVFCILFIVGGVLRTFTIRVQYYKYILLVNYFQDKGEQEAANQKCGKYYETKCETKIIKQVSISEELLNLCFDGGGGVDSIQVF